MPSLNQIKGQECEAYALKWFLKKGYKELARGCFVSGVELDLILKRQDVYYVVEVKSNNLWRMQSPLSYAQKQRLKKAAWVLSEVLSSSVKLLICFVNWREDKIQVYDLDSGEEDLSC